MTDVREILERGAAGAAPPPHGYERMLRRRDRRDRNRRIAAGAVGIAVALAVAAGGVSLLRTSGGPPANDPEPAVSPQPFPGPMHNGRFTVYGLLHGGLSEVGLSEFGVGGSEERWLVECDGGCTTIRSASWTADGSTLAFAPACEGGCGTAGDPYHGIRTLDVATGEERLLLPGERFWALDWSPDGTRIAYVSGLDGRISILELDDFDGVSTRALPAIHGATSVSWSPDGTRLAYSTGDEWSGEPVEMFVAATDGSNITPIGQGHGPEWSPDGSRIAYRRGCEIWVSSEDGSSARRIAEITFGLFTCRPSSFTGSLGPTLGPVWSPDGTKLAIVARRGTSRDTLFVMNSDGSNLHEVGQLESSLAVTWRPIG
jgi:Tol biopolymer transport system component